MSDTFNSYRVWLDTPDGQRPASHYALFGLPLFESDPSVVLQAAERLLARVRRIRPGVHVAEWQALIDEVQAAKTCLTDATAKAAYDAQLRSSPPTDSWTESQPAGAELPSPGVARLAASIGASRSDRSMASPVFGAASPPSSAAPRAEPPSSAAPLVEPPAVAVPAALARPSIATPALATPPMAVPPNAATPSAATPASGPALATPPGMGGESRPAAPPGVVDYSQRAPTQRAQEPWERAAAKASESGYSSSAPPVPPFEPPAGQTPAPAAPQSAPRPVTDDATATYAGFGTPAGGHPHAPSSPANAPPPGYPQAGYQQPGVAQPGYPQANYPQPNYPQANYPQPNYPQANYPQPNYPQPGYSQPTYPPPNYPEQTYPMPSYPASPSGYPDPRLPQAGPYTGQGPVQPGAPYDPTAAGWPPGYGQSAGYPVPGGAPQWGQPAGPAPAPGWPQPGADASLAQPAAPADSYAAPAKRVVRRRSSVQSTFTRVLALGCVLMAGVLGYLIYQRVQEDKAAKSLAQQNQASPSTDVAAGPPAAAPGKNNGLANGAAKPPVAPVVARRVVADPPDTPPTTLAAAPSGTGNAPAPDASAPAKTPNGQSAAPADPAKKAAVQKALAGVMGALGARDVDAAKKLLAEAKTQAQGDDAALVARYENLTQYVGEFWRVIRLRVDRFQPLEEVELGKTRIIIVEGGGGRMVFKSGGRVHNYTAETMPAWFVTALAESTLGNDAQTRVIFGAFLAVDPNGDRQRAKQLWEEASLGGVKVRELLPAIESLPAAAEGTSAAASNKPAPPDDKAKLDAARAVVRERFQKEFDGATNPVKKAELAKKLLAAEPGAQDAPEVRYVLLTMAWEAAVEAGKADMACTSVDKVAGLYDVDALAVKTKALEQIAQNAHGSGAAREVALLGIKIIQEAMANRRLSEADRLVKIVSDAARKAQNATLLKQAATLGQQLKSQQDNANMGIQ